MNFYLVDVTRMVWHCRPPYSSPPKMLAFTMLFLYCFWASSSRSVSLSATDLRVKGLRSPSWKAIRERTKLSEFFATKKINAKTKSRQFSRAKIIIIYSHAMPIYRQLIKKTEHAIPSWSQCAPMSSMVREIHPNILFRFIFFFVCYLCENANVISRVYVSHALMHRRWIFLQRNDMRCDDGELTAPRYERTGKWK